MNCDICHKDTTAGSHVNRGRYFEVHICPSCLMWSDDLRAMKAREIINNFKYAFYVKQRLWQRQSYSR